MQRRNFPPVPPDPSPGGGAAAATVHLGVLHGAFLAKNLGYQRISVAEFGVAGGQGLICLENAAALVEQAFELTIDVYGFDTGVGLPAPADWRDLPQHFSEGGYPMDRPALEARLRKAQLMIGPLQTTAPALLAARPAPSRSFPWTWTCTVRRCRCSSC